MPRRGLFFQARARDQLDLHVQIRRQRRDAIKGLLPAHLGGTLDQHVKLADELLTAAKAQLQHPGFGFVFQKAHASDEVRGAQPASAEKTAR